MHHKHLWNVWFGRNLPFLPCPHCRIGTLILDSETLKEAETFASQAKKTRTNDWNPADGETRFSALMKCRHCGEVVAVLGLSSEEEEQVLDSEGEFVNEWVETFSPRYFLPAPPVFAVMRECPKPAVAHLERAFGHIWNDSQACANALRAAVEALLDDQGVAKTRINKRRNRVPRYTHERLEAFKAKNSDAADYLMAIKWIGNAGSHETANVPKRAVLLDGFELFEEALNVLYSAAKVKRLKKLAKEITTRRGKPKQPRTGT